MLQLALSHPPSLHLLLPLLLLLLPLSLLPLLSLSLRPLPLCLAGLHPPLLPSSVHCWCVGSSVAYQLLLFHLNKVTEHCIPHTENKTVMLVHKPTNTICVYNKTMTLSVKKEARGMYYKNEENVEYTYLHLRKAF